MTGAAIDTCHETESDDAANAFSLLYNYHYETEL
jgi:hypothetical protein